MAGGGDDFSLATPTVRRCTRGRHSLAARRLDPTPSRPEWRRSSLRQIPELRVERPAATRAPRPAAAPRAPAARVPVRDPSPCARSVVPPSSASPSPGVPAPAAAAPAAVDTMREHASPGLVERGGGGAGRSWRRHHRSTGRLRVLHARNSSREHGTDGSRRRSAGGVGPQPSQALEGARTAMFAELQVIPSCDLERAAAPRPRDNGTTTERGTHIPSPGGRCLGDRSRRLTVRDRRRYDAVSWRNGPAFQA